MAKRLILVRHAKAEYGAIQDAERSLTKTGQRQALQLGLELAQRLDRLDLMIISPAKRAQQTAEPLIGSLLPRSYCQEDAIYSGGGRDPERNLPGQRTFAVEPIGKRRNCGFVTHNHHACHRLVN